MSEEQKSRGAGRQTAGQWRCDVCNRTMNVQNRESHLSGKAHRDLTAAGGSQHAGTSTERASRWKCDICDKMMNSREKESHLSGKSHRKRVAAQQNRHSKPPPPQWKCDVCGCVTDVKDKDAHLSGQPHQDLAARQSQQSRVPPPGGISWMCNVCKEMVYVRKETHRHSTRHRELLKSMQRPAGPRGESSSSTVGVAQWMCDFCDQTMLANRKDNHLFSQGHRQKVLAEYIKPDWRWEPRWRCDICDQTVRAEQRESHLFSRNHRDLELDVLRHSAGKAMVGEVLWMCNVCGQTIHKKRKEIHLASDRHRTLSMFRSVPTLSAFESDAHRKVALSNLKY
ncbi:uncharacterized protein BT62DRAFT_50041 [Guyanagaster necrorhizus]|uniref:C2H2-type domain-containing protein n=1 Tax=Guyanagaster necrorhizus TaxID=856835 RepID=A0A9P7W5S2_9AGAR|nr:uncharacterized protein BT62DRAFT_50041 [Guyanagaster necrorhizus MCA 3950]KAG7453178.1 hypothetical protein BT62DRAFT_50041 [Guyanagaster necrorhizus MCA 3950]